MTRRDLPSVVREVRITFVNNSFSLFGEKHKIISSSEKAFADALFTASRFAMLFLHYFMENNLIVNPFIKIQFADAQKTDYFVTAPTPQIGLQKLKISKSEQPNLHELFLDLAEIGFNYFDCEKDIDETERDLLFQSGILVAPENAPEMPLFACLLNDLVTAEFDGDVSSLIVDPTFRFEPFNFANFLPWIHEKHLLPHKPSVWIKQPVTEIEIGYWFENEQAETLSKFTAGERLTVSLEKNLLSKLVAAGILTTPKIIEAKVIAGFKAIEEAQIKYQRDKYVVLPEILPAGQMAAMRRFFRQYINQGFMPFDDQQSKRYYQHNEPLATFLHLQLARLMSLVIGEEAIPSYVYAASYIEKADLTPHTDRAQCEFSISFQVDYLPEPENQRSPWGLFVTPPDSSVEGALDYNSTEFPAASEAEDKNTALYLASGDGVIYKGRELVHYRYPLAEGHKSTSLFFHYVPKSFEGNLS